MDEISEVRRMKVAYVRVSTDEQHEQRQVAALEKYGIEKWYIEKVSGKNAKREQLQTMLDFVREGDVIYIHDLSRLARSLKDLLDILQVLNDKSVTLVSNKENLDTSTATGRLMVNMIAAINQFELENLHERQREGIEEAKKRGVYKGRKKKTIPKDVWEANYQKYMSRELNKSQFAREIGVSRPTLDKLLKEHSGGVVAFE